MPVEIKDQSVFEQTYHLYLGQLKTRMSGLSEEKLGISIRDNSITLPLLNKPYHITENGVFDDSGNTPLFYFCVILFKYLLIERGDYPKGKEWCSYRDLKDSKPLIGYFKTSVEDALIKSFSGNVKLLEKSCLELGGESIKEEYSYDTAVKLNLLPRIPVLLLLNDVDEEFPASCSVLFEQRAENYLDAECLAMLGVVLVEMLTASNDPGIGRSGTGA